MNADRRRRIEQAIAECDRYIAKEAPRDAALRPAWAAQTLAHAYAHRETLRGLLARDATLKETT